MAYTARAFHAQLRQLSIRAQSVRSKPFQLSNGFSIFTRTGSAQRTSLIGRDLRGLTVMATYKDVTPGEALELVEREGKRYLDVRTPQEFAQARVKQAVNIPLLLRTADGQMEPNPEFMDRVSEAFPDKAETFVVSCQIGGRSKKACDMLSQAGYNNIQNLAKGLNGWLGENLPVEH